MSLLRRKILKEIKNILLELDAAGGAGIAAGATGAALGVAGGAAAIGGGAIIGGALTAATLIVPLILFTIRVLKVSQSMSSAIIKSDLPVPDTPSRIGNKSFT